jgi:type VI secretion system protein ImpA
MPAEPGEFDIESLLLPISAGAPAGFSLRYEGTYDRIREARREDDPTLPQGDWETKRKVADFKAAGRLAADALARKSKDLQIAAWLVEAWLVLARFHGLERGLRLVALLLERYWADLFPPLDDEGGAARVSLIEWLDQTVAFKLRQVPLVEPTDRTRPFSLADWEAAMSVPLGAGEDDEGQVAPRPTKESLYAGFSLAGRTPWASLRRDVDAVFEAVDALEQVLALHVDTPPRLRRTKDTLLALRRVAEEGISVTKEDTIAAAPAAGFDPGPSTAFHGEVATFRAGGAGAITSRAEAYYRLSEAADYLLRSEPHSPVPYLVKRAVSWGNMSLNELLFEFVSSPDDLVTIQRLLGMRGKE